MPVASQKELGPDVDRDCKSQVHEKNRRQKQRDIEPLIARDHGAEAIAGRAGTVARAGANQSQIVNKKHPTNRDERRGEREPAGGLFQLREQERFNQGAADVKKVMAELERPANDRNDVQDRTRPKDQDDQQAAENIGPKNEVPVP